MPKSDPLFHAGHRERLKEKLLDDKLTPADIIIKNFEGSWNGKISKLVEYSRII